MNILDLTQLSLNSQNISGKLAQEIYDEFLVCKICYEKFKSPKCLSCLHTFCEDCIEKHISGEVTYNKQTDYHDFTCPLCRKRTQLPLGGVKKLPDNFLISGLSEMLNKQTLSPSPSFNENHITTTQCSDNESDYSRYERGDFLTALPNTSLSCGQMGKCEICSQVYSGDRGRSTTPNRDPKRKLARASSAHFQIAPNANAKCLDCNKLLCNDCVLRHKQTHVTKTHSIFELESEYQIACTSHSDEMVRFYCQNCDQCVCILCTFHIHRDHEVISFKEALSNFNEEIVQRFNSLEEKTQATKKRLDLLDKASERIRNIENDIRETSEALKQRIEEDAQDMIRDLHKRIGRINMDAIERKNELEQEITEAESFHNETKNLLDGHEIIVLTKRSAILERFKRFSSSENQTLMRSNSYNIDKEIFFHPGKVIFGVLSDSNEAPKELENNYTSAHMIRQESQVNSPLVVRSSLANKLANENLQKKCVSVISTQTESPTSPEIELQTRSRAVNTEPKLTEDRDTNTHPRGVQTMIKFVEDSEVVEDSFVQLPDGRIVNKADGEDVNFEDMDNLTRARLRRKFREKGQTFDETSTVTSPNTSANVRRTSLYSASGGLAYKARRNRFS